MSHLRQAPANRLVPTFFLAALAAAALLSLFFFGPQSTEAEGYEQTFSSGDRAVETSQCWTFLSTTIRTANGNGNLIDGPSLQTNQLTNAATSPSQFISPCSYFSGSSEISFRHYVHSLSGSTRKELNLVAVNQQTLEEDTLFTHVYTSTALRSDTIDIALEGNYKLAWRWWGIGGVGRAWMDDVKIGGNNISDPSLSCACASSSFPVEWVSLEARQEAGAVRLHWVTATESQSDYFEVERATDGLTFAALGRLAAAGNSQEPQSYTYIDRRAWEPGSQSALYRIRQVDLDGSSSYSQTVEVLEGPELSLSAFPNPASDQIEITFGGQDAAAVVILDIKGQELMSEAVTEGKNQVSFRVAQLPAGWYLARVVRATGKGNEIRWMKQ